MLTKSDCNIDIKSVIKSGPDWELWVEVNPAAGRVAYGLVFGENGNMSKVVSKDLDRVLDWLNKWEAK